MPQNPQSTFSPTALKHYLHYPTVITTHLEALHITTINGAQICLSSLHSFIEEQVLDYHLVNVICPEHSTSIPHPIANYNSIPKLSQALVHQ